MTTLCTGETIEQRLYALLRARAYSPGDLSLRSGLAPSVCKAAMDRLRKRGYVDRYRGQWRAIKPARNLPQPDFRPLRPKVP